jgi:hypothetical protein
MSDGDIAAIYGQEFDTSNAPEDSYSALPPGWYTAMVEKAEMRTTRDGTGRYLWLQFEVVADRGKGRKLFTNINLVSHNQQAEEIGARELAQLGAACELLRLRDSSELVNKVIQVRVSIKKDDPNENSIKAYKGLDGGAASAQPPAAPAAQAHTPPPAAPQTAPTQRTATPSARPQAAPQAAPAAAGGKLPWQR